MVIILTALIFYPSITGCALGTTEISRYFANPWSGKPGETFMFVMTYTNSENRAPDYVQVVVDGIEHDLTPVNPEQDNYTVGKDYMVRLKLDEGVHVFYFITASGNESVSSPALTINVKASDLFTHLDVVYGLIFGTIVILIPMLYAVYLFRKIARSLTERELSVKKENKK